MRLIQHNPIDVPNCIPFHTAMNVEPIAHQPFDAELQQAWGCWCQPVPGPDHNVVRQDAQQPDHLPAIAISAALSGVVLNPSWSLVSFCGEPVPAVMQ